MSPMLVHDFAVLPIVAKYLMMSKGYYSAAASHAELSGAPAKVTSILKAAVPAGSLADPTSAGGIADLQLASTAFIDSLRTTSVFVALLNGGMTRAPLRTRINLSSTPAVMSNALAQALVIVRLKDEELLEALRADGYSDEDVDVVFDGREEQLERWRDETMKLMCLSLLGVTLVDEPRQVQ